MGDVRAWCAHTARVYFARTVALNRCCGGGPITIDDWSQVGAGADLAVPLQLLTAVCASLERNDHSEVRRLLAQGHVHWPTLTALADDHRLTGYLWASLHVRTFADIVPQGFLSHARHVYLQQWSWNGRLFREMERIAGQLESRGMPCLFFKGPLLANSLYPQLGSRATHDIDLLIPESVTTDYASAFDALGYRRRSRLLLPMTLSRRVLYQLEYESETFALEPHWSLQRHPSLTLDHERMWRERTERQTPGGAPLQGLSDEYTLLANILSVPSDLQNGSLKLRTFFEIHLLQRRFPAEYDWAAFWERRQAEHTARVCRIVFAVSRGLFGPVSIEPGPAAPIGAAEGTLARQLLAQVLAPDAREWPRKRLAWGLFDSPLPVSLIWWGLTLPVRALAHPGVTGRRLSR